MSIATTLTLRCDRCGHETLLTNGQERPDGWGSVVAWRVGGGPRLGADGRPDDLCPPCAEDLLGAWFCQVAPKPAAPPAPIATPPAPRRPELTIEDRKRAIDALTGALLQNVVMIRDHLRADPTSILSEDVPAPILEAVEIHAQSLVSGIVTRLNLKDASC
ncbi:hypothetical protein KV697_06140 [Sphingomonas sanguinis]|uniref:hypothetical protein n=1 Tax=Sphingomonas sanguinis TaxID=33051 RepID=UPI001C58999F|nr:hypothetical protein [Sphingomonas sanguinis]QXT36879.1 hypothetical protein KV697_06140 [Sphingomonas sanguinis]